MGLGHCATATAANLIVCNLRQFPCDQIFHNRSDLRPGFIMKDLNPHLFESHERPHTDTSDYQGIHIVLGKKIYRDHAAALNMAIVGQSGYAFYFAGFHIHQGKHIAVPKMTGPLAIKTACTHRRNSYPSIFHKTFSFIDNYSGRQFFI
jgi:hypothetical protein